MPIDMAIGTKHQHPPLGPCAQAHAHGQAASQTPVRIAPRATKTTTHARPCMSCVAPCMCTPPCTQPLGVPMPNHVRRIVHATHACYRWARPPPHWLVSTQRPYAPKTSRSYQKAHKHAHLRAGPSMLDLDSLEASRTLKAVLERARMVAKHPRWSQNIVDDAETCWNTLEGYFEGNKFYERSSPLYNVVGFLVMGETLM